MTEPRQRRPISRGERRVTYALKILVLIALSTFMLFSVLSFLSRISSVAVIVIGAIFFTYVVYPLVRRLNARLPLGAAIGIVYFGIALVIGIGLAVIVPPLSTDIKDLVANYPAIERHATAWISDPQNPFFRRLPLGAREYITTLPAELTKLAQHYAGEAATKALGIVLSTVAVVATCVVIPVLSAYMMLDAENLKRYAVAAIPVKARPKTLAIVADLEKVLGGFIRGQFTVGATIGACITIVLLLFHIKYAVLIGVFAGLFDVIPYVGAVVGFIPSVLLALFQDGVSQAALVHAGYVAIAFIAIFQLEGHFIAPKIVSDSVGLSPLWVVIAILIGGELLGIGGMFLAVPIAAMIRVLLVHFIPLRASIAEANPGLTIEPLEISEPGRTAAPTK